MQLNIPVHQTITLPDAWQACRTPQELSYWLIAKFNEITTGENYTLMCEFTFQASLEGAPGAEFNVAAAIPLKGNPLEIPSQMAVEELITLINSSYPNGVRFPCGGYVQIIAASQQYPIIDMYANGSDAGLFVSLFNGDRMETGVLNSVNDNDVVVTCTVAKVSPSN